MILLAFLERTDKASGQDFLTINPRPGSHVEPLLVGDHGHLQAVLLLVPLILLPAPGPRTSIDPFPASFSLLIRGANETWSQEIRGALIRMLVNLDHDTL